MRSNAQFAEPRDHRECDPAYYCEHDRYVPRVPPPPATPTSAWRLAAEHEFARQHLLSMFGATAEVRRQAADAMEMTRMAIGRLNSAVRAAGR